MDLFFTAPIDNGVNLVYIWMYFNAGSYVDFSFVLFIPTAGQTRLDLEAAGTTAHTTYASAHSYTVTNIQKWYPTNISPKPYQSYEALVSQTGTSTPTATVGNNDFSGVTMTWARTGAGVYTLTANSAVFTAGKTLVLLSQLQNLNGSIRAVVTSTTVITVTTAVQSLAVLGLLGFTATNTDALLIATGIEVRVYP
jgi:hypothetical protein